MKWDIIPLVDAINHQEHCWQGGCYLMCYDIPTNQRCQRLLFGNNGSYAYPKIIVCLSHSITVLYLANCAAMCHEFRRNSVLSLLHINVIDQKMRFVIQVNFNLPSTSYPISELHSNSTPYCGSCDKPRSYSSKLQSRCTGDDY
ncbi:uncharacterized protein TNCV_3018921 [Trichonephila clavipes]|nr:uncharacterized protein TNCV_3018921 [Trichonephila clavipes]